MPTVHTAQRTSLDRRPTLFRSRYVIVGLAKQPERLTPAKRAYGMDQNFFPWSPTVLARADVLSH
jgi:hypothetical protein